MSYSAVLLTVASWRWSCWCLELELELIMEEEPGPPPPLLPSTYGELRAWRSRYIENYIDDRHHH
jgi:hypothetical protein